MAYQPIKRKVSFMLLALCKAIQYLDSPLLFYTKISQEKRNLLIGCLPISSSCSSSSAEGRRIVILTGYGEEEKPEKKNFCVYLLFRKSSPKKVWRREPSWPFVQIMTIKTH